MQVFKTSCAQVHMNVYTARYAMFIRSNCETIATEQEISCVYIYYTFWVVVRVYYLHTCKFVQYFVNTSMRVF